MTAPAPVYSAIDLAEGRILLSNDDGVNAPGLKSLAKIAKELCRDVWICAPEAEQSGAGHSLTMRRPLRIHKHGPKRFAVDGTPTDATLLGIRQVLNGKPPALMLSGVNKGANLAEDMTYSGTVSAAMEATLLGIPAVALSLAVRSGQDPNWACAEVHAPDVIRKLLTVVWPRNILMNVNFPDCPPEAVQGIRITRQGTRKLGEQLEQRVDMRGESYYWIGPIAELAAPEADTDVAAIRDHCISITPLNVDLTDRATMTTLAGVFA